ncbi:MAG: hypothetical protein J0L67_19590 [Cytophagales bacterium]|jgi:RNA polymerase subunit RPABC4/transcription elongation factor Spt4|nr:hypothetical protein [Cytophagales bacterium]
MKKKECPSCAMEIEAGLKTCPICQYEFPQRDPAIKWVAIVLIIAILFGIFFLRSWF